MENIYSLSRPLDLDELKNAMEEAGGVELFEDGLINFKLIHRGVILELDKYRTFDIGKHKFLYVDCEGVEYIYYSSIHFNNLLKFLYYSESKDALFGIDFSDKSYCIELKKKPNYELMISFITTVPSGCKSIECGGLNGLFKVLYQLLKNIGYNDPIILEDDVQINGEPITYKRLLEGKGSIYTKYGFMIEETRRIQIDNVLEDAKNSYREGLDIKRQSDSVQTLYKLCRMIPMISITYKKFAQC